MPLNIALQNDLTVTVPIVLLGTLFHICGLTVTVPIVLLGTLSTFVASQ